jgi:uncharacterized membrane protein (DUF106 family)
MVWEIILQYPRTSLIIIAGLVSFFITLVNYFVLDEDQVRASKAKQKELQKQIKEHKGNPAKAMEIQKEMMGHALDNMRHSLKPMLITMIPVIIVFWLLRDTFAQTAIAGSWLWYYIISAIAFSLIFRKLFKLP